MTESNNVIAFPPKKLLNEIEPVIQEVAKFRHFYDDNMDSVQFFVDGLLEELAEFYGFDSMVQVSDHDYALLIESTMSVLMRVYGIEHILCAEFAKTFIDRPEE
jgi:hypothetical protein